MRELFGVLLILTGVFDAIKYSIRAVKIKRQQSNYCPECVVMEKKLEVARESLRKITNCERAMKARGVAFATLRQLEEKGGDDEI